MPQIEISQFVKSKLDELKEEEEHKSYDSTLRSLLNKSLLGPLYNIGVEFAKDEPSES